MPHIRDFELFSRIAQTLDCHSKRHRPEQRYHAHCNKPVGSLPLIQVLELLAAEGWHPVFSYRKAHERNKGEFMVARHMPSPTTHELDAAPFLSKELCLEGGWGTHLDGDTLHAKWEDDIGHPDAPVVDVRGEVRDYPTAWTAEAQKWLAESNMMGGDFAPIIWHCNDPRVNAHTHYLHSSVRFPRSLTPRCAGSVLINDAFLDSHGEPDSFVWDDEGRGSNIRMYYRQSDIDRMHGIDIARTYESFPTGGEFGRRMPAKMIFSQRFRRWADELNLGFTWQPILIID